MKKSIDPAFNQEAPVDERTNALGELMANHRPIDSEVREVVDYIRQDLEDQDFQKALRKENVVQFPAKNRGKDGMQSVFVDDFQIIVQGGFIEKPGVLSFDSMRAMVEQTPILSSVIMTRLRQVQRFCRTQESGTGPGFLIRHIDRDHQLSEGESESIQLLQRFFDNCGWEFNPRQRRRLRRDSFTQFMTKLAADSLIMDSCAIETEFKRDRRLGMDGLYAVDGSTIRLCSEEGYRGEDEVFALQVVQGIVRTAYTYDDLIYEPRNARSSVLSGGYGMGEVELLVRTVTGYLNALTYNSKYFDSNSIPKGILHLSGNYTEQDISAFKRYWNSMVKGVNNAWSLPVLISKDQESKAGFEALGVDQNEMMFARWMTFLTSIICAVFGMDPAEINSDAFSAGTSPLSGSDTAERLAASKDKGLRPFLAYFENLFTDYVVHDFSDKYVFRWTGLDEEDEDKRFELRKLVLTVDELRAEEGYEAHEDPTLGKAPVNPSLTGIYMQSAGVGQQQDGEEDFGQVPGDQGDGDQNAQEQDGGNAGDQDATQSDGSEQSQEADAQTPEKAGPQDFGKPQEMDFGKSMADAERFGMPVLKIGEF